LKVKLVFVTYCNRAGREYIPVGIEKCGEGIPTEKEATISFYRSEMVEKETEYIESETTREERSKFKF